MEKKDEKKDRNEEGKRQKERQKEILRWRDEQMDKLTDGQLDRWILMQR
jgi:hypothetical protein